MGRIRRKLIKRKPSKTAFRARNKLNSTPHSLRRSPRRIRAKKGSIPSYLKCVPEGKHGSGSLQKRLWRLKSDFCRIRDWYKYGGKCVATGKKLPTWNHGQAGHFIGWPKCNGMFKFYERNIHLQSAQSNSWPDRDTWKNFEIELKSRYGREIVEVLEEINRQTPMKITNEMVLEEIERTIRMIAELPEPPPYFNRLLKNRVNYQSLIQP